MPVHSHTQDTGCPIGLAVQYPRIIPGRAVQSRSMVGKDEPITKHLKNDFNVEISTPAKSLHMKQPQQMGL